MSTRTDPVQWYDANADLLASKCETVRADKLHLWLDEVLSADSGAQALDVGVGSGRDAAWLAYKGYAVIAVEPSAKLRAAAKRLHPEATIRWLDDRLPDLSGVTRLGLTFAREPRGLRHAKGMPIPWPHQEGMMPKLVMHGSEKSDPLILPMKPANNVGQSTTELAEGSGGTERNAGLQSVVRTQSRDEDERACQGLR